MRHNIAFLVLILLFTTLLTTSNLNDQRSTLERSNDGPISTQNTKSNSDLVLNQVTSIVYDGVVSTGEYAIKEVVDPTFDVYYSTDASTIYMALVGVATGYVSMGFGSPIMQNSDIIIGYFDGATNIRDTWAPGYSLTTDTSQDIISSAAGESAGVTTLEFSRLLDTGDTTQDNVITIGVTTDILWGYSAADDFVTYHSARGSTTIVFSGPPSSPQNLVATPLNAQVDLSCNIPASDGGSAIQSYNIYRSDISGGGYSLVGTSSTLSFSDTTVVNDQTYYYVVRAENSMGEGSNSNEVSVLPTQSIPGPQNLIAVAGTSQVTLSWQPPT
ncbi:MAG: DOMON domain-containing protein, partial [Candidatus Heimdallarchaeota archaeon]